MIVLRSYIWKVSDLQGALEITWSLTAPRLPHLYKTRKTVSLHKSLCALRTDTDSRPGC